MGKVILFGEPMALLISETTGTLENAKRFSRSMSGAEVNVAIGLTRLGHSVSYLTRLGNDPFGHYIEDSLRINNINTDCISYDNQYKTGIQLKNRVSNGSDPLVSYYRKGSAASHINSEQVNEIDLNGVDLIHVTGIPAALSKSARKATYRLIERAKENGIYVTFDPNLRPSLWSNEEEMIYVINDIARYVDMILPGISECKILTGTDDLYEAAKFYQNLGVKTVIIKNGKQGAYIKDNVNSYYVKGYPVSKVVDTVGAGDGFAVGVISGKLEGLDLTDMVKRGTAIGAIQVMNVGDNEGLPNKAELESFMEEKQKIGSK